MRELWQAIKDGEWILLALVAIGVVIWSMWNGINFFDSVNSLVLAVFWFAVISAVIIAVAHLIARRRS